MNASETTERPRADETETRTILVVDDRASDRALVRRLLRNPRRDYTIVEATTGEAGLAACRSARPDCVLLDFHLPDMTGEQFLHALQEDAGQGPLLPIAMLTGEEDDAVAASVLQSGAADYLVKDSLSGPGLRRAIENAIEKFQIRRELDAQRATIELRNHRLEALRDELQARMLELEDATRTKDRFLAVMSHEMRTPLNAILGYSELLDMELDGQLNDGQRQQIERIRVGSRHLLDLVNDVLDLTRADARKLELDLRPVDVRAVLEEVMALLERQATAKGLTLVHECDESLPLVHADLQRMRQVLTNLIGNALKFTQHGEVRVRCVAGSDVAAERGIVRIEVVDTGIGIDRDTLPLVFEEFYQAQSELTRRYGGSGLGLAISRRLAQLMGGDVVAQSELGKGSTFTLLLREAAAGSELRAHDVAEHGARMAVHAEERYGPPSSSSIVVAAFADDAEALAELERRVRPNVRLVWTTSAEQVTALAIRERPTLMVLDIGSTDGAAWRAAHAMQDAPELASTAVLLLPSLPAALPDEPSDVLDLGWISLVPKPFTAAQLTQAVTTAAESSGEPRNAAGGGGVCEVLVVDDDADSRRVAATVLSEAGVTVREAEDGESALMEMRRRAPDVVVLDLMMPVLDGFGVLAAMRADPLLRGIPTVVLTAKSLTDAERRFLSRSAVRVLQKGAHRLADVAALVLRAAASGRRSEG